MVVPTSAVVCGRADGLHWPIERFRFEWLSGSIGPDSGRGATGVRWAVLNFQCRRSRRDRPTWVLWFKRPLFQSADHG